MAPSPFVRRHAVIVEAGSSGLKGRVLGGSGPPRPLLGEAPLGAVMVATGEEGEPLNLLEEELAPAGSALAALYAVAERFGLSPMFPAEVRQEVQAWVDHPGIDDPELEDWTHRPFVTIDNEDSRDLDQAMYIERIESGGFRVFYALADAAYYVRPGTYLHKEAMRRGVTYYLPSMSIPMLPRDLSEGIVSLNEGVDRRALALVTELGADAHVVGTEFKRVRIRSHKKLSYRGVQAFLDGDRALPPAAYLETLHLLREVGEKRRALASEREVVEVLRDESRSRIDPYDPTGFEVETRSRDRVEVWNEQISLLCNAEGAAFMEAPGNAPYITPIYRIHPEPLPARVRSFFALVQGLVESHRLDPREWGWDRAGGESLAQYLARLPTIGARAGLTRAIHRQAIMINRASEFSAEPGEHHGVGVDPYARFSSPMREMVGIYTHREALEKLSGQPPSGWVRANEVSRAEVVALANQTKSRQKQVEKAADKLVLDHFLARDLTAPPESRPVRGGLVLGVSARKVYMRLDAPPLELKLYVPDLESAAATAHATPKLGLHDSGAWLRSSDPSVLASVRIGDSIRVRLWGYDEAREHYRFALVSTPER